MFIIYLWGLRILYVTHTYSIIRDKHDRQSRPTWIAINRTRRHNNNNINTTIVDRLSSETTTTATFSTVYRGGETLRSGRCVLRRSRYTVVTYGTGVGGAARDVARVALEIRNNLKFKKKKKNKPRHTHCIKSNNIVNAIAPHTRIAINAVRLSNNRLDILLYTRA